MARSMDFKNYSAMGCCIVSAIAEVNYDTTRSTEILRRDAPLTGAGFSQAERLADFLSDFPVDFIATSRYKRALHTIEPYAERTGLRVRQDHRLNERVLSAEPIADWEGFVRRSFEDPDLCVPGGESAREVLCRVRAALEDVLDRDRALPLAVTHGNAMALLLHSLDTSVGYPGWRSLTNPDVYLLHEGQDGSQAFQRVWLS